MLWLVCRKENVLDIGSDRKAYLEKEGLLGGQLVLVGRRVSLPNFFQGLLFKHDIHHMITGFGTDLAGELKLLCWEVGAGTPWYYLEKYTKFPLVFLFKPLVAMTAFKLGKTQHSLYDLEDALLRSKTLPEIEHHIEFGQFSAD